MKTFYLDHGLDFSSQSTLSSKVFQPHNIQTKLSNVIFLWEEPTLVLKLVQGYCSCSNLKQQFVIFFAINRTPPNYSFFKVVIIFNFQHFLVFKLPADFHLYLVISNL